MLICDSADVLIPRLEWVTRFAPGRSFDMRLRPIVPARAWSKLKRPLRLCDAGTTVRGDTRRRHDVLVVITRSDVPGEVVG